jgi:hypothetical protein
VASAAPSAAPSGKERWHSPLRAGEVLSGTSLLRVEEAKAETAATLAESGQKKTAGECRWVQLVPVC